MKWQYKGKWFKTIPIDWDFYDKSGNLESCLNFKYHDIIVKIPFYDDNNKLLWEDILVYVPKHDACYTIQRFGTFGNGNKVKMCLKDIYTKREFYCQAKNVELVIKCN